VVRRILDMAGTRTGNEVSMNEHHYCPMCGRVKVYDAQGSFVDPAKIAWCTCVPDAQALTEGRIREIVREELDKWEKNLATRFRTNGMPMGGTL
jgi:hypothetical protein